MSWPKACLGDVAQVVSGATPKSSVDHYWDGDIPWITPADLSRLEGKEVTATSRLLTEAGLSSCSSRLLPPRSVLFSSRAPIGHVAINTVPMATNQGFKSFIPNQEILSPDYLYWWLKSSKLYLQSLGRGATFKEVSKEIVESIEIPLPPLEEQRRIAAILDKASGLSRNLAIAVQLEDEFNASLFDELIGDPVINAKGFTRSRLADLCGSTDDIKCGPFGTQLKQHEFRPAGVPLWGIKHVNRRFDLPTNEFLEEETATRLSAYSLESRDIVMTRKGTVGNCCVYPDDLPSGIMHSDLLRIRLDERKCLPFFAAYQLHHSADIKRQIDLISGGAIMAGINVGRLKEVQIVVPDIAIQKEFESLVCRGSFSVWQKHQNMIRRSRELVDSLSTRFFLGSQVGWSMT
jgi:type I restriction enzyme S subunit